MIRFPKVATWKIRIMKILSDKITGKIYEIIYNAEYDSDEYSEMIKQIVEFYGNSNNYTYPDLVKRKTFLLIQKKRGFDIFFDYFMKMYIPVFTSLCTVVFTVFFISEQVSITPEDLEKINELSVSGAATICVLLSSIVLAAAFAVISSIRGRKFRKYELVECELSILEQRLQKYHDDVNQQIEDRLTQQRASSQATNQNSVQNNNTPNDPANTNSV